MLVMAALPSCLGLDAAALLRSAMLSEVEANLLDADAPKGVVLNLDTLVRGIPDASRRSLEKRFPDAYVVAKRALGGPASLLRIAFDGAFPNAPEGETVQREHSAPQQALQKWLFSRCDRLPATGLRQECVKRLAAAAAALEREDLRQVTVDTAARRTTGIGRLQAEAVVALGLGKRSTYLETYQDGELSATEDLAQAKAAADEDDDLRRLLGKPEVAAAMERIAADPSEIKRYAQSVDVMEALQRLNAKLKG